MPSSKAAGRDLGEPLVIDLDTIVVVCHSEKVLAAPTFFCRLNYRGQLRGAGPRASRGGLRSAAMTDGVDEDRDLSALVVSSPAFGTVLAGDRARAASRCWVPTQWATLTVAPAAGLGVVRGTRVYAGARGHAMIDRELSAALLAQAVKLARPYIVS